MSQNMRNQPGEGHSNTGRAAGENREKGRYESFEGMNYEQRRPSYSPQQVSNNEKNESNGSGSGKPGHDL